MTTMSTTTYSNTPNGVLSICCLGKTGVGKSTLLNRLLGDTSLKGNNIEGGFQAKRSTVSVTKNIDSKQSKFNFHDNALRKYNRQYYKLVDTPGLNDSEGGDKVLVDRVVDFFKQTCNGVNIFLILHKISDDRVCSNTKGMLKILEELFGRLFWKHVMIVFTRYDINSHGECEDKEDFDANVTDIRDEICKNLSLNFKLPVACIGKRNYVNGIDKILSTGLDNGLFSCQYMKGWDQLSNQRDKQEQEKMMKQLLQKVVDLEDKVKEKSGFRVFGAIGNFLDTPFRYVGNKVSENCMIM